MKQPLYFLLLLFPIMVACSFKVPSVREQQALGEMGAFPGGVPAWIAPGQAKAQPRIVSGVIPTNFSAARTSQDTFNTPPLVAAKKEEQERAGQRDQEIMEQEKQKVRTPSHVADDDVNSYVRRIERSCSNIGTAITAADTPGRVLEYEKLLEKCPTSAELWFLLGKEYLIDGQLVKSEQALTRAVELDPSNIEAVALREKLKKQNLTK